MTAANTVTFYLHPQLRKQAERGHHNFIAKIAQVLTAAGMTTAFDSDDQMARLRAMARTGRSLFLMDPPVNARGLTLRKTYIYPFWHIEKQAERWDWPVARATFDPAAVDPVKAANFYKNWQRRLFDGATDRRRQTGFVFIPLQGRLTTHRSFQHCSPIDMIRAVLDHDRDRQVIVTLHPSETYPPEEQAALDDLLARHGRLTLGTGAMQDHLRDCDYIVTQNSGVAFQGYFFAKPVVLFGRSDFHHIARNVADIGVAESLNGIHNHAPDYAAYLYWFLQLQAINAGRPDAQDQIATVLRGHGWPV